MEHPPTKRRSWLRPRFSLRVLLLAFTAFAIGFPIWYRWPYEEVKDLGSVIGFSSPTQAKQITTWQRQWGGGRLKHGPERCLVGKLMIQEVNYRNGKKHGPYIDNSMVTTTGQYADGLKEGVWTELFLNKTNVTTWHHGEQVSP